VIKPAKYYTFNHSRWRCLVLTDAARPPALSRTVPQKDRVGLAVLQLDKVRVRSIECYVERRSCVRRGTGEASLTVLGPDTMRITPALHLTAHHPFDGIPYWSVFHML
jgi:hypothetical protein